MEPIDEISLQEGDQDITATEEHGADFDEEQEHRAEAERRGRGAHNCRRARNC